jgi:putative tryptophan/tyrosine transport system substrate-binding protein
MKFIEQIVVKRRDFIAALVGATLWPLASHAQPAATPTIGFISSLSQTDQTQILTEFRRHLAAAGYVEKLDIILETRFADGDHGMLPTLAAELIHRKPNIIVAEALPAALAIKAVTNSIPIIFVVGADPVAAGLSHPGANTTGMNLITVPLGLKRLELLLEMVPGANVIGMLVHPDSPDSEPDIQAAQAAAQTLRKEVKVFRARNPNMLGEDFKMIMEQRVDGLIVGSDQIFTNNRRTITELLALHRIPAVYPVREYVTSGGLLSYGPNLTSAYQEAAAYLVRILKGERPADLPVLQPSTVELVVNWKTAKMLGVTISPTMLARADEVIE